MSLRSTHNTRCHELATNAEDKPLPNEGMLQFLRRKERFYELILCAWDNIEFNIDQIVARQFELYDDNSEKSKFVLDTSFGRKLAFLKRIGEVTSQEFQKIRAFQKRRNDFFHSEGWGTAFVMSQDERKRVMDEAVEAAQTAFDVLLGAHNRHGQQIPNNTCDALFMQLYL